MTTTLTRRERFLFDLERTDTATEARIAPVLSDIAERYEATAKASVIGRMPRSAISELLMAIYGAIACWRDDGAIHQVKRVLRRMGGRAIDFRSNDYLVLLRASLPKLPPKRASKWEAALDAADHHDVDPTDLGQFLIDMGGIEGAARERARLWATIEDGAWAHRSPLRCKYPRRLPRRR